MHYKQNDTDLIYRNTVNRSSKSISSLSSVQNHNMNNEHNSSDRTHIYQSTNYGIYLHIYMRVPMREDNNMTLLCHDANMKHSNFKNVPVPR